MSEAKIGKPLSEEHKLKLSEAHSGNKSYKWIDIPEEKIMEMKSLRVQGYTYEKIAETFNISIATAWKRLNTEYRK